MNAAYSLGTRLTNSFAKYGMCVAMRGVEGGGLVDGLPVHNFVLIYLGVQLIDNASLDAVAEAAAARNRWEFLFTTAPLALRGGTGSPVNPIATF